MKAEEDEPIADGPRPAAAAWPPGIRWLAGIAAVVLAAPKLGLSYLDAGRTLIVVGVGDARRLRRPA